MGCSDKQPDATFIIVMPVFNDWISMERRGVDPFGCE
jgi:hypothetical protein